MEINYNLESDELQLVSGGVSIESQFNPSYGHFIRMSVFSNSGQFIKSYFSNRTWNHELVFFDEDWSPMDAFGLGTGTSLEPQIPIYQVADESGDTNFWIKPNDVLGKDPVTKFERFAMIGPGLESAGIGMEKMAAGMDLMKSDKFESLANGMDVYTEAINRMSGAMLAAMPIMGMFYSWFGMEDFNDAVDSATGKGNAEEPTKEKSEVEDTTTHQKIAKLTDKITETNARLDKIGSIMLNAFGPGGRMFTKTIYVTEK